MYLEAAEICKQQTTAKCQIPLKFTDNKWQTQKQNAGLPKGVTTIKAWLPFLCSRVTLLARPTSFQKTLWLAQPGQIGQGKTIRAWLTVIGPGKAGSRLEGWRSVSEHITFS